MPQPTFLPPPAFEPVPAPLSPKVVMNPPMVGEADPFSPVDAQNRDLILQAIREWARSNLFQWSAQWDKTLATWLGDATNWLSGWDAATVKYVTDSLTVMSSELRVEVEKAVEDITNSTIVITEPVVSGIVDPYIRFVKSDALATDFGGVLNAAFASAPSGTTVKVKPGSYFQSTPVVCEVGDRDLIFDARGMTAIRNAPGFIQFLFRVGYEFQRSVTFIDFTNEVIDGTNTPLTVLSYTESPGYVKGDTVKLISDAAIPGGRLTTETRFPRLGQHFKVHAAAGTTVKLIGIPVEWWEYKDTTNLRTARQRRGRIEVIGGTTDVTDAMMNPAGAAAAVLRFEGVSHPRTTGFTVERAVGPAIQHRSCVGYRTEGCVVKYAMNDNVDVHGYGWHDVSCEGGSIDGSNMAMHTRHGFADKSTDLLANSSDTAGYGRTMFFDVALKVMYSSESGLDTHQESYGGHFHDNIVRGGDVSIDLAPKMGGKLPPSAVSVRGMNTTITNLTASGFENAVGIFTESNPSNYKNGETRGVVIDGLYIENGVFAIYANIHTGKHDQLDRMDTERTFTARGIVARNMRGLVGGVNYRGSIDTSVIELAPNPASTIIGVNGSSLDIGTLHVDGTKVTEAGALALHRLINSSTSSNPANANPASMIRVFGSITVDMSDAYASKFTDTMVTTDLRSEVYFPSNTSLILNKPIPGKVFDPARYASASSTKAVMGWSIARNAGTSSTANSGAVVVGGASVVDETSYYGLAMSPERTLVAIIAPSGNVAFPALRPGRQVGQQLTIVVNNANTVTFTSDSAKGLLLNTATKAISGAANSTASLNLVFTGSVWREI